MTDGKYWLIYCTFGIALPCLFAFELSELDLQLNQLTTWIEPVLLLIMGFLVGGIVIVMYLPVFQLADTV